MIPYVYTKPLFDLQEHLYKAGRDRLNDRGLAALYALDKLLGHCMRSDSVTEVIDRLDRGEPLQLTTDELTAIEDHIDRLRAIAEEEDKL